MKVTLNWLQEYVPLNGMSPETLADKLTMLGLEVDSVTPLFQDLKQLKTAFITEAKPHPDADKLSVCTVEVGDQTLQIVCGAPNARTGLCTVVALPGTVLPGNFKIKKSKVRGVESQGMLCSERELGLSEDHTGIMELPSDTPHGLPFLETAGLQDTQIEVDLTPNRPDCASVIGIAREVAGISKQSLTIPFRDIELSSTSTSFSVEVESAELCPRYSAKLLRGVTIAPSPWWLRKRLLSIGLRPVNNIVDVTNLVMMEYGQPLHAFDFNTLAGHKIIVRIPKDDEIEFTTLDHVTRKLERDTLMICDGDGPVAVAGVMGGLNSEVTDESTDILLESACFNAVSIRKTARRLNLPSEASYRFERGVDPEGTLNAMERAITLMQEIAGGVIEDGGIDVYDGKKTIQPLFLRVSRTAELLGIELNLAQVRELLESIQLGCEEKDEDTLLVVPPAFRVDLEREIDLVEEVARLVGYNEIPVKLPDVDLSYPEKSSERVRRNSISSFMTSLGYSEAINYSFYADNATSLMRLSESDMRSAHVKILNPLSEDLGVMRTTLLPGLLENIRRNINFQQTSCKLFEIGKVFHPVQGEKLADEPTRLCGVLTGQRNGERLPYHFDAELVDIFDAKGAVEALLSEMRISEAVSDDPVALVPATDDTREPYVEPGYAISVIYDNEKIGSIGKVKSEILKDFGIKRDLYYFDLAFSTLCKINTAPKSFSSLPVFPSVKRDIALVVPTATASADLVKAVLDSREKLVENCDVFDVYQGNKIKHGYKSLALSITYRSKTKTLTEKNVEKAHSKLVKMLTTTFSGTFREA